MTKPLLVMFIGFPGSGKTYFATRLAEKLGGIWLNSDAMRMSIFGSRENIEKIYHTNDRPKLNSYTFGAMDYVTKNSLKQGISVIYDAIQRTHADRDHMAGLAKATGVVLVLVSMKTDVEVAVKRGISREDTAESRRFEEQKMRDVVKHFDEGLESLRPGELAIEISGELPFEEQYEIFSRKMRGADE